MLHHILLHPVIIIYPRTWDRHSRSYVLGSILLHLQMCRTLLRVIRHRRGILGETESHRGYQAP